MKKHYSLLLVLAVVIGLSSCSEEVDDSTKTPPIDSTLLVNKDTLDKGPVEPATQVKAWNFSQADEKVIAIPEKLNMGASYKTIQELLPDFKGVRAENKSAELANKGFTEGMYHATVFNKNANCTFHFKNDSLYSYDVAVPIMDMKEAEKKYGEIKAFYSDKYGQATTPNVEEDNYTRSTVYWQTPKGYVVLINDLSKAEVKFGIYNNLPK